MSDLTDMLDQLDEARAKGTPGPWKIRDDGVTVEIEGGDRESVRDKHGFHDTDAALIVAAVNALPDLVGALRGCLRWADQLDREALALGAMQHDLHKAEAAQKRDAAAGIRAAVTAALTPGADTAGATA